jgi:hypothetical protein
MDTFTAISIIEGIEDAEEFEIIDAWQYLIDTGVVWSLQGSYGRMANDLIATGVCYLNNSEDIAI